MANEVLPENYSIFARIVKTAATHLGEARNKYLLRPHTPRRHRGAAPHSAKHQKNATAHRITAPLRPRAAAPTRRRIHAPPHHRFIAPPPRTRQLRGSSRAGIALQPRIDSAPAPQPRSHPSTPAASNPQRSGGVSRGKGESKEDLGGNRNPPNPPWPPEAATRLLTQQKAAQERRRDAARQHQNAKQHPNPFATRQSVAPERSAPPPPTTQRSGGVSMGNRRIQGGFRGKSQSP